MNDCIFCKIADHRIPSKPVYEDSDVIAFDDLHPKAPTHILLIPKKHIEKLSDMTGDDSKLGGKLLLAVGKVAEAAGIKDNGFRVVVNNGKYAGQEVFHLHLHILGGKPMGWNPA
ncbi:histidine triad nucleotide-binding protein [bacterium]|nr:histidine triad nucleotide-binding protein [bacterium]